MKLKLKKYTLAQGTILFAMLMEAQFFYIVKLPSIFWFGQNSNNKGYIFIIMYATLFLYLLHNRFQSNRNNDTRFTRSFMLIYSIICAILIIRSMLLYDQNLFDMTQCADFLFAPPLVFLFMIAFNQKNGFNKTVEMIVNIVFVIQLVIFIQSILYQFAGIQICYGMRQSGLLSFRNGEMRSPRFPLNFFGIAYAFNQLIYGKLNKSERKKNVLFFLISIYNIAFCTGYRTLTISMVLMLIVILMFSKEIRLEKKLLFILVGIVVAFAGDISGTITDLLSATGTYRSSNVVRYATIDYFWERFIQHPILGWGMIRATNSYTAELSGLSTGNYVLDAAIVGNLSEIGILGVALYVALFIRGFYIAVNVKKSKYRPLLFGMLTYAGISMFGLSIIAIPRCTAIPVLMAYFEYIYFDYKRGISDEDLLCSDVEQEKS